MTNFIYDNTALPGTKSNVKLVTNISSQWSAEDANAVFAALDDIRDYLRTNILDASQTTTIVGMDVVNNSGPTVNPAIGFIGYDGHWLIAMDTANTPTSRDFVPVCVRLDYSFSDGVLTNGSPTLTSASGGGFASVLIGTSITGIGIPSGTTIVAVGSATSLTLSNNATTTATSVRARITSGITLDLEYWRHRGALSPTCGIGVTPPDGSARLQVSAADSEPAMGTMRVRRGPSQTGNVLTLHDSVPTDRIWVDKDFYLSGNNSVVGCAVAIAGDTTNQRALCLTGSDKASVYAFSLPTGAGGLMRLSCASTGDICFDVFTDGSFKHQAAKYGAFGATPIVKPTVTGSRGGNAALASLLTGLASLGWVTDSTTA